LVFSQGFELVGGCVEFERPHLRVCFKNRKFDAGVCLCYFELVGT